MYNDKQQSKSVQQQYNRRQTGNFQQQDSPYPPYPFYPPNFYQPYPYYQHISQYHQPNYQQQPHQYQSHQPFLSRPVTNSTTTVTNKTSIYTQNMNGLRTKLPEFLADILSSNWRIYMLNETGLDK